MVSGSRRRALLGAGSCLATMMIATGAMAQQASPQVPGAPATDPAAAPQTPSPDNTTASDQSGAGEIIVTGSRIRRRDATANGPLLTITSEDLAKSGSSSVGDLLQKIPAAGVSLNSNGSQGTSYGVSAINLRYLGGAEGSGNRVLVLVDGHRWVDAVGARGFRDFVDLNTMPAGMIDGIEVLKDGASAIYGSDAIAGVVNIKTVQPFDGLRATARAGVTDKGDGAEYAATLNVGKKWSTGSIILSGSYFQSEPILTTARELTTQTLVPVTAVGQNPNGLYILPGLAANAYFGTPAGFGSSTAPIVANGGPIGAGNTADNSFHVGSLPGDFYNTQAQGIYSTGPSKRYGFYARIDQEVLPGVTLKVEGLYNRRKSLQLLSPQLLDIGGRAGTFQGFAIPADQAFNPFGTANGVPAANAVAFPATSTFRIRRVTSEVGNRTLTQDVETFRVDAGLNGQFKLLSQDWNWSVYGAYSKNKINAATLNYINNDNLFLGIGSPAACAASPGCVPVNLFGPMTAAQANYIRSNSYDSNSTELLNFTADVTGTLFDLPAGPVQLAVGYEYRQNRGNDSPDPFINAPSVYLSSAYARTTSQTRTPTNGKYSLNEAYGELSVPIFKDQPFAKSLDIDLAARYSSYSTVGDKVTFKAGAGYRPIQDILFRGTFSQGFRAPSILELYQGARQTNFQGVDPCNGGAAVNAAKPGCAGIPATYNQSAFNSGLLAGVISGNRNLKPETADTYSAGVALTPRFLPGLTLTVDYFNIKVKNAIASQTATQILGLCATQGGVFCNLVTRDASSGAVTAVFQTSQNANSISTSGIDATVRYDFSTSFGRFGAVVDASYLHNFTTVSPNPAGGAAIVDDRAGLGDQPRSTYPHWKGQASLNWTLDAVDAVVRGRYIGPTTDIVNTVKDSRTKSIIYTDFEAGFAVADGRYRLAVGVDNVFDLQPPASYANAPINYDIYTYDARGRFLYVRASIKM